MFKRSSLVFLSFLILAPAWSTLAALDPSLVAWWAFDEGTGTVAVDGSGNGNDGVVNGGPSWVTGPLDGALDFAGTDSSVVAPHIPLDNRSFSIAMWVNLAQNNAEHVAFGQQQAGATNTSLHLRLGGTGNPAAGGINFGFYSNDLVTGGGLLELNTWYHLGFVYDIDAQQKRIYIDGELADEGASTPYLGTSGTTNIGMWINNQYFNGMIDDVQVYHKALSDGEVKKIMSGLADQSKGFRRFVYEKPFGNDLESARNLNHILHKMIGEDQIYRIDHYLGKETVQNVLVTRFANGIFEPLWNRNEYRSGRKGQLL